jgi:hypothetical protein
MHQGQPRAERHRARVRHQARSGRYAAGPRRNLHHNGDGTLCESGKLVGGPLAGTELPIHTYVDPKGRWVFATTQDIAYPCPNPPTNVTGTTVQGPFLKISEFGDDPPGSEQLPCTNP